MASLTREELLALTPERYLAHGYTEASGAPVRALLSDCATASCTQFRAAELSPQELSLTAEAVRQLLPGYRGTQAAAAGKEALAVVARCIRQPNNPALARWLRLCLGRVRTDLDQRAFLSHLLAVERQYTLLAALSDPGIDPGGRD